MMKTIFEKIKEVTCMAIGEEIWKEGFSYIYIHDIGNFGREILLGSLETL